MTTDSPEQKTPRAKPAKDAAPASEPAVAPKKSILRWLVPVLGGLALLVIGLFGGILIGQHTGEARGGFPPAAFNQNLRFGAGSEDQGRLEQGKLEQEKLGHGRFEAGEGELGLRERLTSGTVESIGDGSLVIKLADGSTVTVKTSSDTKVTATEKIEAGDLKVGDKVTVAGQRDGDSITANSIIEGQLLGAR